MGSQRSVFGAFMLLALAGSGLAIWGPLPLAPIAHQYADARTWLGIPNSANLLVNLPMFWLAVWGWCTTRTSAWPRHLRLPWQWFHVFVMGSALTSAMYHAAPSDTRFILSHTGMAGAFVMFSFGLLAGRADPRFGSMASCAGAAAVVASIGIWTASVSVAVGPVDLRALRLVELAPLLLIPIGVQLRLRRRGPDSWWVLALLLYAVSKLLGWADAPIFQLTTWISGHTLMHLGITLVVGWVAYRAATGTACDTSDAAAGVMAQRTASLNTSG